MFGGVSGDWDPLDQLVCISPMNTAEQDEMDTQEISETAEMAGQNSLGAASQQTDQAKWVIFLIEEVVYFFFEASFDCVSCLLACTYLKNRR